MPARAIIRQLGGEWCGGYGRAACPVCQPERRQDQRGMTASVKGGKLLLFCHKSQCGYRAILDALDFPRDQIPDCRQPQDKTEKVTLARRRAIAAAQAENLLREASVGVNPYLASQGFPKLRRLKSIKAGDAWKIIGKQPKIMNAVPRNDVLLVIPLTTPALNLSSAQLIAPDGTKYFLAGGQIKGRGWFPSESGARPLILCEGVATGLSILRSSGRLKRPVSVVCCMSAGNLVAMAAQGVGDAVMADNDRSGAGNRAAIKTGLLWDMPPILGYDWNDWETKDPVSADAALGRRLACGIEYWAVRSASPVPSQDA